LRIVDVIGRLIERVKPDLAVIACNTASTLALAALREAYSVPFVGTVPAIKPAAVQTRSKIIGVLATPGTVSREYTHSLIQTYADHCQVFLHGARRLAEIAEQKLKGEEPDMEEIRAEITPVFRTREGRRTDVVVLGCTHYPLLVGEIEKVAPWPVTYIDPALAIARRAGDVLRTAGAEAHGDFPAHGTVLLTSSSGAQEQSLAAYASMGFPLHEILAVPI
jgi:glutamate racemase